MLPHLLLQPLDGFLDRRQRSLHLLNGNDAWTAPVLTRGIALIPHALRGARAEDQPFQQRVAGQPIRAVHAGAGHLARGIEAGQ